MTYTFETQFSLETFDTFNGLIDYVWKARQMFNDLRKRERDNLMLMPEEARTFRWDFESRHHDYLFPMALHYSFIVLIHIEVEARLKATCDIIQKMRGIPLNARDLRGDTIEQCMIFLDKLVGIPRDKFSYWPDIADLAKIRNCIVHASGRIEKSRDKVYLHRLVQQKPNFLYLSDATDLEDKQLVLKHDYCMYMTAHAREFFVELFMYTDMMKEVP